MPVDPRITKLASMLVKYSCGVKKGDKILVESIGFDPFPLMHEITVAATRAGGIVYTNIRHDRHLRALLREANEEQIKAQAKYDLYRMKDMQCYIGVRGTPNTMELSDVPSEKLKMWNRYYNDPVHMKIRVPHTRWVVLRWPNDAMAQNARKALHPFEDFYFDVCTLDYGKMSKAMDPLKKLMQSTDRVRVTGPGTDLSFSIKRMPAIKCDGHLNIPDGEIFTAPVKASVNGTIRFNTRTLFEGTIYEGISLTFRNGKVIEAEAGSNTKRLNAILDRDAGARYLGEFAFGVNPYIRDAMLDTLFDEKISGSIHFALGNSYDEAPNGNKSSIHWDIVLIQRRDSGGGEIRFDGKVIRKDGLFLPATLKGLNPDRLK
ncbi:MAG: aminopeptidase [Planctomycetes bacterium]|nr:aminopeptidase [Planctomycetota bacterium]